MFKVFLSPRYCRVAGQVLLALTGLLYLIALLQDTSLRAYLQ